MTEDPSKQSILLVEDDPDLADMVADYLRENGFHVQIHPRGDTAAERILTDRPDAVILDVNLPGVDGYHVCRQVRDQFDGIVLMLTARSGELDEVLGLECGADDYLAKPVRPKALLARLKNHMRKHLINEASTEPPTRAGSLIIDTARRRVELEGKQIELTSAEFDLLRLLVAHAGHTLSRAEIYQSIHGIKYDGMDRSIDLRISRLRKKLGDDPAHPKRIKSIHGTGYLLATDS